MTEPVQTPRLDLVALTPPFYALCLAGARDAAAEYLGATIAADWWEEQSIMAFWLQTLHDDPSVQPWLARAMVRRADQVMIGHIGCHGHPGMAHLEPFAPGGVELGYRVFPTYRRHGYATEALHALITWAAVAQRVPGFVLSIVPDNVASQAVARRLGFVKVGSHIDEVDGLEEVFALSAPRPL